MLPAFESKYLQRELVQCAAASSKAAAEVNPL